MKTFPLSKKAAKRENIEIRVDDIPEILQLIKNLQQGAKIEIEETTDSDTVLDDLSLEPSHADDVDETA